jgi:2-keto-4-pentenoate hydratase
MITRGASAAAGLTARALQNVRWITSRPEAQYPACLHDIGHALADAKGGLRRVPSSSIDWALVRDLTDAYLVQQAMEERLVGEHRMKIAGWKAGATNDAVMSMLGVSEPFVGPIFNLDVVETPARVRSGHMTLRGGELEYVFEFSTALDPRDKPYSLEEVEKSIGAVYPAIEIVASRSRDPSLAGTNGLIADQAGHGCLVRGLGLKRTYAGHKKLDPKLPCTLFINGIPAATGDSTNVLGNPINAVQFVVNFLTSRGQSIAPGQFVSSGTVLGKPDVAPSDDIEGEIEGYGKLRVGLDTL